MLQGRQQQLHKSPEPVLRSPLCTQSAPAHTRHPFVCQSVLTNWVSGGTSWNWALGFAGSLARCCSTCSFVASRASRELAFFMLDTVMRSLRVSPK